MNRLYIILIVLVCYSCGLATEKNNLNKVVKSLNYEELAPLLSKGGNKTYVVNFWATWCKPCVDELPFFEKINREFKSENVEVLLVSLDFSNQIEEQLIPFIKDNNIRSEIVVLDDPDQNKWIDAIDSSWSGALPATIIYNKVKRNFYERSFDEAGLLEELHKFIK